MGYTALRSAPAAMTFSLPHMMMTRTSDHRYKHSNIRLIQPIVLDLQRSSLGTVELHIADAILQPGINGTVFLALVEFQSEIPPKIDDIYIIYSNVNFLLRPIRKLNLGIRFIL
jgi:hypothetical protein